MDIVRGMRTRILIETSAVAGAIIISLTTPIPAWGWGGPSPPITMLVTLAAFVWMKRWMAARSAREVLHEQLAARAVEQHEAFLNHDQYGIFGDYPPRV